MNPSLQNKIFEERPSLSEEQIKAYLEDRLTPSERNSVEQTLESDPLSREALEGYSSFPGAFTHLDDISSEIHQNFNTESSFLSGWGGKLILFLSGAVLAVASIFFFQPEEELPPRIAEKEHVFEAPQERFIKVEEPVKNETSDSPIASTDNAEQKPDIRETHSSTGQVVNEKETPETKTDPVPDKLKDIEPSKVEDVIVADKKTMPPKPFRKNYPIVYIENYKTIDYSDTYGDELSEELSPIENGLSARYENEKKEDIFPESHTINHQYDDVLEIGLLKMQAGKYFGAQQKFQLILSQFPEDQNALFYGGLCYYYRNKTSKAIASFDLVIADKNDVFYEEAEWYKALALLKSDQQKEAISLMKAIKSAKSFYSEQAEKKLKTLETN